MNFVYSSFTKSEFNIHFKHISRIKKSHTVASCGNFKNFRDFVREVLQRNCSNPIVDIHGLKMFTPVWPPTAAVRMKAVMNVMQVICQPSTVYTRLTDSLLCNSSGGITFRSSAQSTQPGLFSAWITEKHLSCHWSYILCDENVEASQSGSEKGPFSNMSNVVFALAEQFLSQTFNTLWR